MTLAELRALCERAIDDPTRDDYEHALVAAARTWLPALIEVAEAAQKMNECVPGTSSFAKHFVTARKALAQLDEVGRTG